jgi:hypothetical protein
MFKYLKYDIYDIYQILLTKLRYIYIKYDINISQYL